VIGIRTGPAARRGAVEEETRRAGVARGFRLRTPGYSRNPGATSEKGSERPKGG